MTKTKNVGELQRLISRFMHEHNLERITLRRGTLDITWCDAREIAHRERRKGRKATTATEKAS